MKHFDMLQSLEKSRRQRPKLSSVGVRAVKPERDYSLRKVEKSNLLFAHSLLPHDPPLLTRNLGDCHLSS